MFTSPSLRARCSALLLFALFLSGCQGDPPPAEPPPPPVTICHPVVRTVTNLDEFEGRIAASQKVDIRARVRGYLIRICFDDGQMVKGDQPPGALVASMFGLLVSPVPMRSLFVASSLYPNRGKGDVLFEIDPSQYQADYDRAFSQIGVARAKLDLARSTLDRDLETQKINPGAVSKQKVAEDRAAVEEAAAAVEAAKANAQSYKVSLDYTKITAPFDGKIGRSQVDVGNLINAGGGETLLTTVVAVEPMYVYFNVDERTAIRYRNKDRPEGDPKAPIPSVQELDIPVYVALEGDKDFPHKGVIDFVDNKVNPGTGTVEVRGVLNNRRGLFEDGYRARVQVPMGKPYKAVMVVERAVGTDQGRRFVYVVNKEDRVERRDVTLGRVFDGLQVITEGLAPTDRVIINGIQRVRDGVKVTPEHGKMPGAKDTDEIAKE
jgi:RND family efflux transporter MFP subunit